jgi:hypothetical protein
MNKNFETILLDEWLYIPLVVITMVWAFGIGMCVGWIWTLAL